mgnify:CR=1 FL=1
MLNKRKIVQEIVQCFQSGGKIIVVGNGGSATMASHLAGEFIGKFEFQRKPLPAISLFDLSSLTAIANDYGYEYIFSRPLEALGKQGDILIILSTSGKSKNCLRAIQQAKKQYMTIIDWPRKGTSTAKIQEFQLKLIHDICREVEKYFV